VKLKRGTRYGVPRLLLSLVLLGGLSHRDRGLPRPVHGVPQGGEPVLALDRERDAAVAERRLVALRGDGQDDRPLDVAAVRGALGEHVQHRVEAVERLAEGEAHGLARHLDVGLLGPGRLGARVVLHPLGEVLDGAGGDLVDQFDLRLLPVLGRLGLRLVARLGGADPGADVRVASGCSGGLAAVDALAGLGCALVRRVLGRGKHATGGGLAHVNHTPWFVVTLTGSRLDSS